MQSLFTQVNDLNPEAVAEVSKSRLILHIQTKSPVVEVTINGRVSPPEIIYGSNALKPDLDVELDADAFHFILLGELRLRKALSSKQLKVRGPIWKAFVLEGIFQSGQYIYPEIMTEAGIGME